MVKSFRVSLTSSLTASIVLLATAGHAEAGEMYEFILPTLLSGCLFSPTHPDCYADQNVIRASGFSHDDGTDAPRLTPVDSVPPLLQKPSENPFGNTLWQRLKNVLANTPAPLHVIDQSKTKTSIGIMFGREIFVDQDYNHWTQFSGDWFVLMSNQFNQNKSNQLLKLIELTPRPFSRPFLHTNILKADKKNLIFLFENLFLIFSN